MKKIQVVSSLVALALCAGSFMGCGKKKEDTGTAALVFSNNQNSPVGFLNDLERFMTPQSAVAASFSTPIEFKMKLIAAYLVEDMDPKTESNVGKTGIFYLNPECAEDIKHCDVSGGTAEDGTAISHIVTGLFDFAKSSQEVNSALNAQSREIPTASYKYVRLEFCKLNQESLPNIAWQGGLSNVQSTYARSACTVNSVVMNPPLVLAKGEAATVQLDYDYSESIQVGADAQGDHCVGSGDSKSCFTLPTFIPSAKK